jgi:hypothetical protein
MCRGRHRENLLNLSSVILQQRQFLFTEGRKRGCGCEKVLAGSEVLLHLFAVGEDLIVTKLGGRAFQEASRQMCVGVRRGVCSH